MMPNPLSAAFAAGGELESGCQADYGIQALGKRRTIISFATYALRRRVCCAKWIGAGSIRAPGEKLPEKGRLSARRKKCEKV